MRASKLGLGDVVEGARRVVHGAGEHAGERKRYVVVGIVAAAGLGLLHACDGFVAHDVGIGALHARGFGRAVEVDHQMMTGGQVGDAVVPVDSSLIVALDEVDLQAGDAPLFV